MSVDIHRSTGKMILKSFVAAVVLSFAWIRSVAGGTAYSNVYMQSGPGWAFYGPAALRSAQLAPIAAAPLMSSLLPPCISPCVIPSQQVDANPVATSSANFVSFKSPIRVPVVVAPSNDDNTSYEYSYVVYDEVTGDQKAQKESSDGSVVRGQYSLIEPNGSIREVQYTADDIRGFNAVVKNFLPQDEARTLPPCPDGKNEPLKEAKEKTDESHDLEPKAHADSHEGESHEERAAHAEPDKLKEHSEPEKHEEQENHAEHKEPKSQEEHAETKNPGEQLGHEEHGSSEEHLEPKDHGKPESQKESNSTEDHGRENNNEPRTTQGTGVLPANTDALVSYNDVIRCIQSANKGANTPQSLGSPLTYIILNKPC